jgi:hypothetical protein
MVVGACRKSRWEQGRGRWEQGEGKREQGEGRWKQEGVDRNMDGGCGATQTHTARRREIGASEERYKQ